MPNPDPDDQDGLPAPGTRWGAGVDSVLPYLTKTLQARPAHMPDPRDARPRDGHPVFADWPPRPSQHRG